MRFSGILNNTHEVFFFFRLGHETNAKYETCSYSNTDAHEVFRYSKRHTWNVLWCSTGTRHCCEVWNVFIFEYLRTREVLRYAKRHASSVVCFFFSTGTRDWSMKRSCSNTDAFVNYWRPKPKLVPIYIPKTVFKLPSGTHFLILGFLTKPNQMRKEKYQDKMHVVPAKSNQLPWVHLHFISNKSLLNTFKNLTLLLVRVCLNRLLQMLLLCYEKSIREAKSIKH